VLLTSLARGSDLLSPSTVFSPLPRSGDVSLFRWRRARSFRAWPGRRSELRAFAFPFPVRAQPPATSTEPPVGVPFCSTRQFLRRELLFEREQSELPSTSSSSVRLPVPLKGALLAVPSARRMRIEISARTVSLDRFLSCSRAVYESHVLCLYSPEFGVSLPPRQ